MKWRAYLLAGLLACLPLTFMHPVRVSGSSMEPALMDGQAALALWAWCSGEPELGETWIVESPEGIVIKRILAAPGQTLEQRNGYLFRDGNLVEEPYLAHRSISSGGPWQAGDGYLALGDSRPASRDSRLWGSLQRDALRGRVIWP